MEVKIVKMDNFGRGIAYLNGKIVFVLNALEGEVVKIKIIYENKKFYQAIVLEYLSLSDSRIDSPCIYSKDCGGCQLGHFSYDLECSFKEEKVKDILYKYAGINEDIVSNIVYDSEYNYRNKITLHGSNGKLGLYKNNSNDLVEINNCLLVNSKIDEIIKLLNDNNKSIIQAIIRTSNDNKYSMVKITGEVNNIDLIKSMVDVLIINDKYYTDNNKIITKIGDCSYRLGIDSFFQVNNTVSKLLYDEIRRVVKSKMPMRVLDLYCGTGSIGIYVSKFCGSVVGVDCSRSNISDAIENKKLNNINNIDFICSLVEDKIDTFNDIDLVIVDPPRAGLDKFSRDYLCKMENVKTIIYVSCDVVTLGRDLNDLSKYYKVVSVVPFNMFPRTYHCEAITVLERK